MRRIEKKREGKVRRGEKTNLQSILTRNRLRNATNDHKGLATGRDGSVAWASALPPSGKGEDVTHCADNVV